MEKEEFIRLWAIQFSAAYMAVRYDDHCSRNWGKGVNENTSEATRKAIIAEDAVFMAERAWEAFNDLCPQLLK